MKVFSSQRVSDSCSDTRRSKIQKRPRRLKLEGLSVIAFVLGVGAALAQQPKNFAARRRFVVNDQDTEWRLRGHSEALEICAEVCKGTQSVTSAPPLGRLEIENC